ncbi:MAG: hypothetical protein Q27BPR15_13930 [Rhodobacter sp. CACIA14H1]|nr:MAG: hypothetical protein Q27BPR15_13930 [Rhodobacter sp. CACIA14H1]
MQETLAFAPTADDLDDDLFTVPVLTFAPKPPQPQPQEEG